eukprot:TRINITY_DN3848_c0_g1_i3.p1 TRINITY_DN3848_c0_g1~~TRINITY_DN3848_c0_g1_i3.p1  ORF type:complete len:637 (+),score=112.67 TRINITY_DN3848_c0_g1_i3:37-1911(+)
MVSKGGRVAAMLTMAVAASGAALRELPTLDCTDERVIDIVVKEGDASIEDLLQFKTRAYHFEGSDDAAVPGHTIKMHPGTTCTLRVTNNLDGVACNGQHSNDFHCPDTTTLHTHGLHVSPTEDNIDTHIEPNGGTHDYVYHMPSDHLMGTHWYHAHHHGSTAMQVGSGMAGILLVEPAADYELPASLQELYSDDDVHRVPPMMFFHHQFTNFGNDQTIFFWLSQQELLSQTENNVPMNEVWLDTQLDDFYTVNGQYNPRVTVTQNVATLLRMVHGGGSKHITLTVNSAACSLKLIARDGVFHSLPYLDLETIHFQSGTRADVAILCTQTGVFSVSSSSTVGLQPSTINGHDQSDVFEVEVVALPANGVARAMPTSEAPLPSYLSSLMNDDVGVGGQEVSVIDFTGGLRGGWGINGVPFPGFGAGEYVETFCVDTTYEMQIGNQGFPLNTQGPGMSMIPRHPYHQHVNHFQIIDGGDPSGSVMRDGEWRDVAPTLDSVIRFRPVHFTGEIVVHCHLLQHEDQGMMGLYRVDDCGVPPPTPPTPEDDCTQNTNRNSCISATCSDGETSCVWNRTSGCSCPPPPPPTPVDDCAQHTTRMLCVSSTCSDGVTGCVFNRNSDPTCSCPL